MSDGSNSHGRLQALVERIERLDGEIADLNADKREIFSEAKTDGFDVKALKAVLGIRRTDPQKRTEHNHIVATYLAALGMADAAQEVEDASGVVQVQARSMDYAKAREAAGLNGKDH